MPKLSATYGLHEVDVAGHCLQILLDHMLILQIIVHDLYVYVHARTVLCIGSW